ncbi:MFS transporter, partial [Pseudomonas aeruginosa]
GTVATLFGVRNLSMLGGIVFLFHQLGAFLGGWLGGVVYDRTGQLSSAASRLSRNDNFQTRS